MALLRDDQDALFALVGAAGDHLGLRQSWVEKDLWITELLRSVSKEVPDVYTVFKGGTSLSKAFHLGQRFSQDVDILVVVTTERSKDFGKGSIDKRLKGITERAAEDLGLEAEPVGKPTTGEKRYSKFSYPTRAPADDIPRNVLLEMGTRGSDIPPSGSMTVDSYIAEYLAEEDPGALGDYDELSPVDVRVLAPERTLAEKLGLLNTLGANYPDKAEDLKRSARHLYDVASLLRSGGVREKLELEPNLMSDLAPHVERVSLEHFGYSTPRPEDGYGASVVFDPTQESNQVLRVAYERDLPPLVYGELPSFGECLAAVRDCAGLL